MHTDQADQCADKGQERGDEIDLLRYTGSLLQGAQLLVIAGHTDGPADYGGAYTLGDFAEQGIGGVNGAFLPAAGPALLVVDAVCHQRHIKVR